MSKAYPLRANPEPLGEIAKGFCCGMEGRPEMVGCPPVVEGGKAREQAVWELGTSFEAQVSALSQRTAPVSGPLRRASSPVEDLVWRVFLLGAGDAFPSDAAPPL